jgi:lysophospholipase L1-like esterase
MILGYRGCIAPVKIMPLGDSITYGTHGTGETRTNDLITGYRQPLYLSLTDAGFYFDFVGSKIAGDSATPVFDYEHEGHAGWRDDEVADYVYQWLFNKPADIVLLHIGTNELTTSPSDVEDILNEIDRYSEDITVLLARIINRQTYHPETTQFNDNVQAMAEDRIAEGDKIIIVDQESALNYSTDMWDDVHPNDSGYNKMAGVWLDSLDNFLPVCEQMPQSLISAIAGSDGGIVPSGAVPVRYGTDKTFIITPNTGYHVADILVDGGSVGSMTSYTFFDVEANHTIEAIFAPDIPPTVIDNGKPGTSYTGTWVISGGSYPYGADSLWSRDGATYSWQSNSLIPGTYEVSMWWSGYSSRATNIVVNIYHYDGVEDVNINQLQNAGQWNSLGQYYFDTTGKVTITAAYGSAVSTCADAVRFVLLP